jgi:antitoxin component of MazEF toxin-antitoxin module
MQAMRVTIRAIGNSKGIVLPKPVLAQAGLEDATEAEMTVENGVILLRKAAPQGATAGQRPRKSSPPRAVTNCLVQSRRRPSARPCPSCRKYSQNEGERSISTPTFTHFGPDE